MAYLASGKKCDLKELALELDVAVLSDIKIVGLRDMSMNSKNYNEEFTKQMLDRIINDRLEKMELLEKDKQRTFELEKLKIEAEIRSSNVIDFVPSNVSKSNICDMSKLMHKYDLNEGVIIFYLVLFERQARRIGLEEQNWVSQLLGLLPYEITQLIARESEEKANDYKHVKQLLLRKFKLSLERFRQKFIDHITYCVIRGGPKYAEKNEPLTRLTRKDETFRWNEDQQEAFKTLKDHLTNEPVLALYNPEAETEVHTDASSKGLAGMLLQKGEDKKWHLVYCVSKGTR